MHVFKFYIYFIFANNLGMIYVEITNFASDCKKSKQFLYGYSKNLKKLLINNF